MKLDTLTIHLLSETCFGRGDGKAGDVDHEVDHDEYGLPYIRGTIIRGLLLEEYVNLFNPHEKIRKKFNSAFYHLFGKEGDTTSGGILRIGRATLSEDVVHMVRYACERELNPLHFDHILYSLSSKRTMTAVDRSKGNEEDSTLRTTRTLLRNLTFYAPLTWLQNPVSEQCIALLTACATAVCRAGLSRHRGLGFISLKVWENNRDCTIEGVNLFKRILGESQ